MALLKQRLWTPGPTPIPERVQLAMARPMQAHRSAAFAQLMQQLRRDLQWLFGTSQDVLVLAGIGTLAMEAAVVHTMPPGGLALCLEAGRFGERWAKLVHAHGCHSQALKVAWGQSITASQVAQVLAEQPQICTVLMQACETSTGVVLPVAAIAQVCQQAASKPMLVVDGITAVGALDIAMDRDGIDVLLTSSHKALMLPPGLSLLACSERVWRALATAERGLPRYALDLEGERASQAQGYTQWTSPIGLIYGLQEVLAMLQEEGRANYLERHRAMGRGLRAGLTCLSFELPAEASDSLTCGLVPAPWQAQMLKQALLERHGITVGGGQEAYRALALRFGHMGYFDALDMVVLLAALEETMAAQHPLTSAIGASLQAAQQAMWEK